VGKEAEFQVEEGIIKAMKRNEDKPIDIYEEDEIDIFELLQVLYNKRWIILSITSVFTAGALVLSLILPKKYKAEVFFEIVQPIHSTAVDGRSAIPVFNTLSIASVKSAVESYFRSKEKELEVNVTQNRRDNRIGKVEVYGRSPEEAKKNLEKVVNIVNSELLRNKLEDVKIEVLLRVRSIDFVLKELKSMRMSIIDPMYLADLHTEKERLEAWLKEPKLIEFTTSIIVYDRPVSPKPLLLTAVALVSGLFLGIFVALFKHAWEERKKSTA